MRTGTTHSRSASKNITNIYPIRVSSTNQDSFKIEYYALLILTNENLQISSSRNEYSTDRHQTINNCLENILEYDIKIPNVELVQEYLLIKNNFSLLPVLENICCKTKERRFAQISLELYIDPEIDDQYLTIYVRKHQYEDDFMEKIEAIMNEHLNPHLKGGENGWILLTTDFDLPK